MTTKKMKRCAIIYKLLKSKPRSKRDIRDDVQFFTDQYCCISQIEKDLFFMRMEMDIEIRYNKVKDVYYIDNDVDFIEQLKAFLQLNDVL